MSGTPSNFGVLDGLSNAYTNAITGAYNNISPEVHYFVNFAILLSVTLGALRAGMDDDWAGVLRFLVSKIFIVGWAIFLINNCQHLTNDIVNGMVELGFQAGGSGGTTSNFLADPMTIAKTGYTLCSSMISAATQMPSGVLSALKDLPEEGAMVFAAIVVAVAFIVIAIEIIVAILEFKIVSVAAVLFIGFSIWEKTAFLANGSYQYIASSALKLFTLALVVGIAIGYMSQFTINPQADLQNMLSVMTGSLLFLVISRVAPKLAQGLVSGSPQLTGAHGKAAAAPITSAAAGAAKFAGSAAVGGIMAGVGALSAGRAGATGGALEQMRRAATAGVGTISPFSQMAKAATVSAGTGAGASSEAPAET
jgi:type IV secretion system protein TrbL